MRKKRPKNRFQIVAIILNAKRTTILCNDFSEAKFKTSVCRIQNTARTATFITCCWFRFIHFVLLTITSKIGSIFRLIVGECTFWILNAMSRYVPLASNTIGFDFIASIYFVPFRFFWKLFLFCLHEIKLPPDRWS